MTSDKVSLRVYRNPGYQEWREVLEDFRFPRDQEYWLLLSEVTDHPLAAYTIHQLDRVQGLLRTYGPSSHSHDRLAVAPHPKRRGKQEFTRRTIETTTATGYAVLQPTPALIDFQGIAPRLQTMSGQGLPMERAWMPAQEDLRLSILWPASQDLGDLEERILAPLPFFSLDKDESGEAQTLYLAGTSYLSALQRKPPRD